MSSSMSSLYSINSLEISGNPKSCIEKLISMPSFQLFHFKFISFHFKLFQVISCIFGLIKYNLYLSYNSRAFIEL